MTLNEYQERAMATCMATCSNFSYMALNLVGEVGEFASKVAKSIRKGIRIIEKGHLYKVYRGADTIEESIELHTIDHTLDEELRKEAGDILWQLSGLCKVMGWSLEDVAQENLDKLSSRQARGVIDGNGDNR